MTIATVESITGGLFAAEITKMPGASKFFKGSLVTYSNEIKEKLGVDVSNGVINKEVAREMALKGKEYFDVDVCVSFTGNAGPEAMDGMPVGKVFIGINEEVFEKDFKGSRNEIRKQCVDFAFNKVFCQTLSKNTHINMEEEIWKKK